MLTFRSLGDLYYGWNSIVTVHLSQLKLPYEIGQIKKLFD
jgi:hypothetical protein